MPRSAFDRTTPKLHRPTSSFTLRVFQPLIILIMLLPALRETTGDPPGLAAIGSRGVVALTLGGPVTVLAALWLLTHVAGRRLDHHGSLDWAASADRWASIARIVIALWMVPAVTALGWLDVVRGVAGDVVFLDELLVVAPAILAMIATWALFYPIERRFREALLMRDLDRGQPLHAIPTRWRYVLTMARHMLALSFVPLAMILAWRECVPWIAERIARAIDPGGATRVPNGAGAHEWLEPILQFAGALGVLILLPPIVRRVWETVPLGPGVLRDELSTLCAREGVRVREILVWRTGGSMLNGAVLGVLPRLRYILLTDALLESLTLRQVRAVMAHEVAHVRLRHMPWMWAACLAAVLLTGLAGDSLVRLGPGWMPPSPWDELALGGLSIAGMLLLFGWISRRFEWQADAFAVRHLSLADAPAHTSATPRGDEVLGHSGASGVEAGTPTIPAPAPPNFNARPEAILAMAGALQTVSALNHIPIDRANWRHGSILTRLQRLRALGAASTPAAGANTILKPEFPIDRVARWIKRATLLAIGFAIAWMVYLAALASA